MVKYYWKNDKKDYVWIWKTVHFAYDDKDVLILPLAAAIDSSIGLCRHTRNLAETCVAPTATEAEVVQVTLRLFNSLQEIALLSFDGSFPKEKSMQ